MRKGVLAAALALVLLCACQGSNEPEESLPTGLKGTGYAHGPSGESIVLDWGNSGWGFQLKDGRLLLTFGQKARTVPGATAEGLSGLGLFASAERSAVVWQNGENVEVLTTGDQGETWTSAALDYYMDWASVGFTTAEDGWLLLCGGVSLGSQNHALYKTADGGGTWTEVETNLDEVHRRVAAGCGFVDGNLGFLGFRYEDADFMPALLVTQDGGRTWVKADINLSPEADGWNVTPLSAGWDGAQFVLPFHLRNGEEDRQLNLYFDGRLESLPITLRS